MRAHNATLAALTAPLLQVHHLGKDLFKSIVALYRQQPQAQLDTFKSGG